MEQEIQLPQRVEEEEEEEQQQQQPPPPQQVQQEPQELGEEQPEQYGYEDQGGAGQQEYDPEDYQGQRQQQQQQSPQASVSQKEVRILETAEDIQERREQVLGRYAAFKTEAKLKREKLEDSRRFQYFKRDADELESWIYEKLQAASDETFKDATNLQAKIQKHQVSCCHEVYLPCFYCILAFTSVNIFNRGIFRLLKLRSAPIPMLLYRWTILAKK